MDFFNPLTCISQFFGVAFLCTHAKRRVGTEKIELLT